MPDFEYPEGLQHYFLETEKFPLLRLGPVHPLGFELAMFRDAGQDPDGVAVFTPITYLKEGKYDLWLPEKAFKHFAVRVHNDDGEPVMIIQIVPLDISDKKGVIIIDGDTDEATTYDIDQVVIFRKPPDEDTRTVSRDLGVLDS